MKIAPAIILTFAGAAFSGWLLEILTAAEVPRTVDFREFLVVLLAWLADRLRVIAEWLQNRG